MIYTHIIVALIAALTAWMFQDNRYAAELAEQELSYNNARLEATANARTAEKAINQKYQGALNAARTREALLRDELGRVRTVSDGLRDQNADAARRLAAAPPAAVLEYASTLNAVFDDCRAAYGDMAEKATGHASDAQTLIEAWPVWRP